MTTDDAVDPAPQADLRQRAGSRLAGAMGAPARAADALAVLYTLASSPATAADALALLHELQVHQVELDLQAEELRESRAALESALRQHAERHEALPVGCFTLDREGRIVEVNRAATDLLGAGRDQAVGLGLEAFVAVDSRSRLRDAFASVADGARHASCTIAWQPQEGRAVQVRAELAADPSGGGFLVVLVPLGDAGAAAPPQR